MTEEQLRCMSEQEIRRRFRCAPAYYLQAKLDKKRTLERHSRKSSDDGQGHWEAAAGKAPRWQAALPKSLNVTKTRVAPRSAPRSAPKPALKPGPAVTEGLDLPLPGFEILDAALSESGSLDTASAARADDDAGLTQQAILEARLEDYSNWPFLSATEPMPEPYAESDLERKLSQVLDSEPELRLVLNAEPDLEVVLDSDPALRRAVDAEAGFGADNVTKADFGQRPPRTVPVVSVVMDRKRPNMVRVVGKSTRLAS